MRVQGRPRRHLLERVWLMSVRRREQRRERMRLVLEERSVGLMTGGRRQALAGSERRSVNAIVWLVGRRDGCVRGRVERSVRVHRRLQQIRWLLLLLLLLLLDVRQMEGCESRLLAGFGPAKPERSSSSLAGRQRRACVSGPRQGRWRRMGLLQRRVRRAADGADAPVELVQALGRRRCHCLRLRLRRSTRAIVHLPGTEPSTAARGCGRSWRAAAVRGARARARAGAALFGWLGSAATEEGADAWRGMQILAAAERARADW